VSSQNFRKIQSHPKDFQTGLLENYHERTDVIPSPTRVTKREKRTKRKNENHVKTSAHVIALVCMALAGGQMRTWSGSSRAPDKKVPPGAKGKKGTEL